MIRSLGIYNSIADRISTRFQTNLNEEVLFIVIEEISSAKPSLINIAALAAAIQPQQRIVIVQPVSETLSVFDSSGV